jgi:hypothetical protein
MPCIGERGCKSLTRIEMRLSSYDRRNGLESLTRDPIEYKGSPYNLYELSNGKVLVSVDPTGMWFVYCRASRNWGGLFRHCDLRRTCEAGHAVGPTGQPELISCFPVQQSQDCGRSLNGDKCKKCVAWGAGF